MSSQIYLVLKGNKQGLISAGCSGYDSIGNKYQENHKDEIFVYSTTYDITCQHVTASTSGYSIREESVREWAFYGRRRSENRDRIKKLLGI